MSTSFNRLTAVLLSHYSPQTGISSFRRHLRNDAPSDVTSVEQPAISPPPATFLHWLQRLQTPTENVSVWIDCRLQRINCDFSFIIMCALWILLLTYLLTLPSLSVFRQLSFPSVIPRPTHLTFYRVAQKSGTFRFHSLYRHIHTQS